MVRRLLICGLGAAALAAAADDPQKVERVIPDADMIAIPGRKIRMQRTEVTQRQWTAVMGSNPSAFPGPDHPVENVSWIDAQNFIKRLNEKEGAKYRLPTEEEWECACRAGGTGDWGRRKDGTEGPLDAMGWFAGNRGEEKGHHAVALKEPNAWGLHDMHGNVFEWCSDLWKEGDPNFMRMYRGGSWNGGAEYCTASFRGHNGPGSRRNRLGFRLVVPVEK